MEKISVNKSAIIDLANLAEEMQLKIESLELMSDPEIMQAHKRAKEQIKNKEFANWDEL